MIKKYLNEDLGLDVIAIIDYKEGSGDCVDVTYKAYGGILGEVSISNRVFMYWILNQETSLT